MPSVPRLISFAMAGLCVAAVKAADLPQESPFAQSGSAGAVAPQAGALEFAGVTTIGKKTTVNLYDRDQKQSFMIDVGATSRGITVVKYDGDHDRVTIRRNGVESVLGLRAATTSTSTAVAVAATPAEATVAPTPAPAPTTPPKPISQLSQARQEEEARMLVSDLLEIGMIQRRAYEEAQRRAAAGQSPQAAQPTAGGQSAATSSGQPAQPAQPASTATPSGG